MGNVMFLTCLP